MYAIDKKYNRESQYLALLYSVDDSNEKKWKDIDYDKPFYFLKMADEDDKKSSDSFIFDRSQYKLIPMLRTEVKHNLQRDIFVIFGASGSGKTVLCDRMAQIWLDQNPKRKIYFITNNNYSIDKSLTHEIYEFVKLDSLIDTFSDEEAMNEFKTNSNLYDNSLLVFDDIDLNENKKRKDVFWAFLGIILKFKRKNMIHVLFTTHDVSDYRYTRILFVEMTGYILYNGSLMNRNNRVLTDYLQLNKQEIRKITDNKESRWTMINTYLKTVITENEIYSLN